MADIREELAAAIAEKYIELEALAKDAGAYGAIRLDWARYGEDGLDAVLESFRDGLEEFDRNLNGVMSDADYVRLALENIMDERDMDDEQRYKFLSTVKTFAEQSGADRLKSTLDGENENVLRALIQMSAVKLCDVNDAKHADKVMDAICREAQQNQSVKDRLDIRNVTGETADELLRCYAAYCVIRDGKVEGLKLDGECLKFIGQAVKAGQKQSEVLRDEQAGALTGEKAAEALRAIAEVLLVAAAMFISGAAGAYTAYSVMRLIGLLVGFTGAISGVALTIGILLALPAGLKVTCDMIKVCANLGIWLEDKALEPGARNVAAAVDNSCKWLSANVAPAVKQGWDSVLAAGKSACDSIKPQADKLAADAQAAFNAAKPQLRQAADGAMKWMEKTGGELDGALDRLFKAFNVAGEDKA